MTGERDAGFIDDAFLSGRGDHGVEQAVAATIGRNFEGLEDVRSIGRVKPARNRGGGEGDVPHQQASGAPSRITANPKLLNSQPDIDLARARFEQTAVGNHNDACRLPLTGERDAKIRSDTGRLACGQGDQWQI